MDLPRPARKKNAINLANGELYQNSRKKKFIPPSFIHLSFTLFLKFRCVFSAPLLRGEGDEEGDKREERSRKTAGIPEDECP